MVLALVFRGIFIALGALAMQQFSWVFSIFGAFLEYTAINLARDAEHDDDADNVVVRFARTHLRTTDKWDGLKLYIKEGHVCGFRRVRSWPDFAPSRQARNWPAVHSPCGRRSVTSSSSTKRSMPPNLEMYW